MMGKTRFDNDNMGYMYIAEESSVYGGSPVKNIDVVNKNGVFFVTFDSVLHTFDEINRNQRQYKADNIRECLLTEKIQSLLADNAFYGERDHPTQETENGKLTPERIQAIWMPNRSHIIKRPKIIGDELQAHIETCAGTDVGVGFAKDIIQGLKPAFSCRAIASMKLINGKPTVIVRRLITYDWVLYPSHKRAHMISSPKGVMKSIKAFTESAMDTVKDVVGDVLIPLQEILESVGKTDVNTQMIMESFELTPESLCGFDENHTHAIIKDEDNMIYAKISPQTKRRVDDFFSKF